MVIIIIIIIIIIMMMIIIIIIIIIRFSVDAPLHREYPHKLIFIINRAIRNVAQVQKRRVCKNSRI